MGRDGGLEQANIPQRTDQTREDLRIGGASRPRNQPRDGARCTAEIDL